MINECYCHLLIFTFISLDGHSYLEIVRQFSSSCIPRIHCDKHGTWRSQRKFNTFKHETFSLQTKWRQDLLLKVSQIFLDKENKRMHIIKPDEKFPPLYPEKWMLIVQWRKSSNNRKLSIAECAENQSNFGRWYSFVNIKAVPWSDTFSFNCKTHTRNYLHYFQYGLLTPLLLNSYATTFNFNICR